MYCGKCNNNNVLPKQCDWLHYDMQLDSPSGNRIEGIKEFIIICIILNIDRISCHIYLTKEIKTI